ncbi:MAG TPA: hypothetical protein VFI40_05385, partial [Nocardioides sp.]|nr:hypothetical protein [Nocardioides sp.]
MVGLLLPMEAAVAEPGPCPTTSGASYTLLADCVAPSTWTVDSLGTIDGNGHTITLAPGFTGPVIASTPGPNSVGGATSMTIEHLNIDAAGASSALLFSGATGAVHDVHITGGAGTDYGVEVDNATAPAAFGTGLVKIDRGTTIGGYQVAGVYVHGDAKFSVLKSTIDGPGGAPGPIVSGIWAA